MSNPAGQADQAGRAGEVAGRATNLLLAAVIALAAVGFFVGIDYGVPRPDAEPPEPTTIVVEPAARQAVLPSMSYDEIAAARIGPTRRWPQDLGRLRAQAPDLLATVTLDAAAKRRSLDERSQRRAYNGAPPVIPHAVDQLSNDACLACHGAGFRLENRTARQLPHPYLASCMQCHAPPPPGFLEASMLAANTFDGVEAPFEGARAWTGAPPVIPHTTWMRDNCLACHGPGGWPGMETTHPWRQNCVQCHAPSSRLELNPPALLESKLLPAPMVIDDG